MKRIREPVSRNNAAKPSTAATHGRKPTRMRSIVRSKSRRRLWTSKGRARPQLRTHSDSVILLRSPLQATTSCTNSKKSRSANSQQTHRVKLTRRYQAGAHGAAPVPALHHPNLAGAESGCQSSSMAHSLMRSPGPFTPHSLSSMATRTSAVHATLPLRPKGNGLDRRGPITHAITPDRSSGSLISSTSTKDFFVASDVEEIPFEQDKQRQPSMSDDGSEFEQSEGENQNRTRMCTRRTPTIPAERILYSHP
ncbi:hypothetical protein FPV67DRAFT_450004 [Lyophyllum atratum]|nr:hypothetical protein FPV67DRAFT_450004 [Lyophyllum atratum]